MSARCLPCPLSLVLAVALLCAAAGADAAPKVIRPPDAPPEAKPEARPAPAPAAPAPASASVKTSPPPAALTRPAAKTVASARGVAGTKLLSLPTRRPIVLDALHVEGKTDAPRVLFVHAGPTVALEDAPAHPSYLRDDFTAALSSPVRVRVRGGTAPRPTTTGGSR